MRAPQIRFLGVEEEAASSVGVFYVDRRMYREPALLELGKKPLGPVKIQQGVFSSAVRCCVFPELTVGIPGGTKQAIAEGERNGETEVYGNNIGRYYSTNSIRDEYSVDLGFGSGNFTLLIHMATGSANTGYILGIDGPLGVFYSNASVSSQWGIWISGYRIGSGVVFSNYTEYVLALKKTGTTYNFFTNGVKGGSGTRSSTMTGQFLTFNSYTTGINFGAPEIRHFMFSAFDGALSDAECVELTKDPYQFLIPV